MDAALEDPWVVWRKPNPVEHFFCKLTTFETQRQEHDGPSVCVHVAKEANSLFDLMHEEATTRSDLFVSKAPAAMNHDFFPDIVNFVCMVFFNRDLYQSSEVAVAAAVTEKLIEGYERPLHGQRFNLQGPAAFSFGLERDYEEIHHLSYAHAFLFAFGLMTFFLHDGSPVFMHWNAQRGSPTISEQFGVAVAAKWPLFYEQHIQPMFADEIDGRKAKVPFVISMD